MSHSAVCEVCTSHAALPTNQFLGGCASAVACSYMGLVFGFENFLPGKYFEDTCNELVSGKTVEILLNHIPRRLGKSN